MYDIIVVGGGHAGVEAALASARLKNCTLLIVGNKQKIANMPCNPSIGGPAKGIIVREIDALGGEMALATDKTLLQIKMLNRSKGPAVRALRSQTDKVQYPKYMISTLEKTQGLEIKEAYVNDLITHQDKIVGVRLEDGKEIMANAVILATGTYLAARILVGHQYWESGPDQERTTAKLSNSLRSLGFVLIRLKTGTPPRIYKETIDFSKLSIQPGDDKPYKFSEQTKDEDVLPFEKQEVCYLTYTTPKTHQLIEENLHLSSMYSGLVEGIGPRYCPSIEDKVVRFADKERHQIFLEPESQMIDEIYVQGFSTSFPYEIQEKLVHSLPGLEQAKIARYAYAIEYDAIDPTQLKATMESKKVEGLYFAGQVNGTSGYEEAACQGLMAGINASRKIHQQEPLVLRRDEAYIGVLIDDLITKGVKDPYRLLTSRAEYRLLLRHDNAESRLLQYGYEVGLVPQARYDRFLEERKVIQKMMETLEDIKLTPTEKVNQYLIDHKKLALNQKTSGMDFMKRPDIDFYDIEALTSIEFEKNNSLRDQAMIEIKYAGYIEKAYKEAKKTMQMEFRKISADFDYDQVKNLAFEAREKLKKVQPENIGQASRISGVNPSDISILLVYLEGKHRG